MNKEYTKSLGRIICVFQATRGTPHHCLYSGVGTFFLIRASARIFLRQYQNAGAHTFLSNKHKASILTIEEDSEFLENATRAF